MSAHDQSPARMEISPVGDTSGYVYPAFIHYDPERVDYSVTEAELGKLCNAGQNQWKDLCLILISLGIPCLLNAIDETLKQKPFSLTLPMFLNYLVAGLGLVLGVAFGIAWRKSHESVRSIVHAIKQKPKMRITPGESPTPRAKSVDLSPWLQIPK